VKERVDKLAHSLRLPPYTVLPMKNMDTEQRINNSVNILALYNLRQMLRAADDFLLNYLVSLYCFRQAVYFVHQNQLWNSWKYSKMTKYTKVCVLASYNVFFLSILQYHIAFYLSYFTRRCKCY
jgi:hypothetical protein